MFYDGLLPIEIIYLNARNLQVYQFALHYLVAQWTTNLILYHKVFLFANYEKANNYIGIDTMFWNGTINFTRISDIIRMDQMIVFPHVQALSKLFVYVSTVYKLWVKFGLWVTLFKHLLWTALKKASVAHSSWSCFMIMFECENTMLTLQRDIYWLNCEHFENGMY